MQNRLCGVRVSFHATESLVNEIDGWRRLQPDLPSRSEAIRPLLRQALDLRNGIAPTG